MIDVVYKTDFKPGDAVWAPFGCAGWRAATITDLRRDGQVAGLRFEMTKRATGSGNGRRPIGSLRPRDPLLGGKDRPRPLREQRSSILEKALDAAEFFGVKP